MAFIIPKKRSLTPINLPSILKIDAWIMDNDPCKFKETEEEKTECLLWIVLISRFCRNVEVVPGFKTGKEKEIAGMIYNLQHRGLLRVKGKDLFQFLQALVTNDIRRLADGRAQYTLLLNSRGRIVEDLILYRQANEILIESDRNNQPKLRKLFEMFKVQKDVTFEEEAESHVYHADNTTNDIPGIDDPRVPSFGKRILSKIIPDDQTVDENAYRDRRFDFGIPEGPSELAGELPLFMNADIMNGVSSNKGCYLGQELTARALNAPEVRKRLLPFTCSGMVAGSLVSDEGRRTGKVIACSGKKGLALIPISRNTPPTHFQPKCADIKIFLPSWWPADPASVSSQSL